MPACRGCGSPLRFDIASQMLHCSYCDSSFDPYEFENEGAAEEARYYDATIFTCPQCGAELGSTETSAAEFCSFCGAPTVLESRISRMRRPDYIIPFRQTRESSAEALKSSLKKQFFIDPDFKNAEVDRFRGIYMPCWNYHITQQGRCSLKVAEDQDNYHITYKLSADVDAEYRGIPHDASDAFSDQISEILEPYTYKARKPFAPAFLSGFFSDIQDVDASEYELDACMFAAENTQKEFLKDYKPQHGEVEQVKSRDLPETFLTRLQETENTLIPVWFLSYRTKDRVAYAAVNGETGKVVSDAPLSIGKIWACAALLAIPLFFLLNLVVSMQAASIVLPVNFLLACAALAYILELDRIREKDKHVRRGHAQRAPDLSDGEKKARQKSRKYIVLIIALLVIFAIPIFTVLSIGVTLASVMLAVVGMIIALFGAPILSAFGLFRRKGHGVSATLGFLALLAASLAADIIHFMNPISDVPYYAAAIIDLAAILFALTNVWRGLNKLTTRPLPQFNSRGGEAYEQES